MRRTNVSPLNFPGAARKGLFWIALRGRFTPFSPNSSSPSVWNESIRLNRYISKDGLPLENMIREREAANPKYRCLWDKNSLDGIYYRWKVFSLMMGDKEHKWREKPFQMTANGPFWVRNGSATSLRQALSHWISLVKVPPKMGRGTDSDSSDDEAWRERERARLRDKEKMRAERYKYATGAQLQKARESEFGKAKGVERKNLTDQACGILLLYCSVFTPPAAYCRSLKSSQESFGLSRCPAMQSKKQWHSPLTWLRQLKKLFRSTLLVALLLMITVHSLHQVLKDSLLVNETPINVKTARLYLLSDILHNSSAPVRNASLFRTLIQVARQKKSMSQLTVRLYDGRPACLKFSSTSTEFSEMQAWGA